MTDLFELKGTYDVDNEFCPHFMVRRVTLRYTYRALTVVPDDMEQAIRRGLHDEMIDPHFPMLMEVRDDVGDVGSRRFTQLLFSLN